MKGLKIGQRICMEFGQRLKKTGESVINFDWGLLGLDQGIKD